MWAAAHGRLPYVGDKMSVDLPPASPAAPLMSRASRPAWVGGRRMRALPPPSEAEVARMVAEFHARGGQVTVCPPAEEEQPGRHSAGKA